MLTTAPLTTLLSFFFKECTIKPRRTGLRRHQGAYRDMPQDAELKLANYTVTIEDFNRERVCVHEFGMRGREVYTKFCSSVSSVRDPHK